MPAAIVSLPAIMAPTISFSASGGSITLGCASQIGRTYQLQSAESLGTLPAWIGIGPAVTGTGSNITFVQSISPTNAFYRVLVQ